MINDATWWLKQLSIIVVTCGLLTTGLLGAPLLLSDGVASALPTLSVGTFLIGIGGLGWRRFRSRESVGELERAIFE
ncbi:hypothetical protein [Halorubrum trueperi]|uniref:Uncharacterized protein n=1 Tax=Halorubrum trueperi TaxID=2004704 RepID=A0ABD5UKP1_9EURY